MSSEETINTGIVTVVLNSRLRICPYRFLGYPILSTRSYFYLKFFALNVSVLQNKVMS